MRDLVRARAAAVRALRRVAVPCHPTDRLIRRTAGYETRTHGGVGGVELQGFPVPAEY